MADPRVLKLAQVLVNYSLALKPGDKLRMSSGVSALPLLREVYREATRAGAFLITRITDAELKRSSSRKDRTINWPLCPTRNAKRSSTSMRRCRYGVKGTPNS